MPDADRPLADRLRGTAKRALNWAGIEVSRRPYLPSFLELLRTRGITTVVDVGANEGQYAIKLFDAGYRGQVISVEPMAAAFSALSARAAASPRSWRALRTALGSEPGTLTLNVAGNSQSSSVLAMLPLHEQAAPRSAYVGAEPVPVTTADALFADLALDPACCLLKVDVQGYESAVLDGAAATLEHVAMIEMELSLAPLYAGQALLPDLVGRLEQAGLVLWSLRPAFADARNGRLLQADGVFVRAASDPVQ
jgi:FkbM family methyltransferase